MILDSGLLFLGHPVGTIGQKCNSRYIAQTFLSVSIAFEAAHSVSSPEQHIILTTEPLTQTCKESMHSQKNHPYQHSHQIAFRLSLQTVC